MPPPSEREERFVGKASREMKIPQSLVSAKTPVNASGQNGVRFASSSRLSLFLQWFESSQLTVNVKVERPSPIRDIR